MPLEQCARGIDYCIALVDTYIQTKPMCREVLSESVKTSNAAYDFFYLMTARRYGASLVSRDKKLKKIAQNLGIAILPEEPSPHSL
jgi:predicted nucleic acid-binding protein